MYHRLCHIILFGLLIQSAYCQEQLIQLLQPGDTLYRSIDLLPEAILTAPNAAGGFWDFNSLLAPYVHEVYVRPVSHDHAEQLRADLVVMGVDGTERFAAVNEGGISLAGFRVSLDGKNYYMGVCRPAIPWRSSTPALGDKHVYEGVCTFALPVDQHLFPGPFDTPSMVDSARLMVEYNVTSEVDAYGAMSTPSGQYTVIRERKVINARNRVEHKRDGIWTAIDFKGELHLPYELQSGKIYTFWSNSLPEPVAIVQCDLVDNIKSVEFRATPYAGRIVTDFPKVADVFVYPNPSFGEVRFDFVNLVPGEYIVEIYNILGVIQETLGPLYVDGNRTLSVDLSHLKKGTYVYRLVDENQTALRSKRLVIITP